MKNENGYVDSFVKLIQCPTVTNSGHEYFDAFHKVLDKEFPNVTEKCEKIDIGGDLLLYKWSGKSNTRPLVLMAHQDVVPAVGGDWKYPPYSATIEDGKVYGRGAMDCKNTLFSTIQAVDELIAEGFVPEQDVYLSYSDCEETGGPGAEVARDWFKANGITPFLVVDEGGAIIRKTTKFMTKDVAAVGILEKGYADVKFIARGKGGHSSQPPKNTPIARLAAFVNYCEKHTVFKPKMSKAAKAMIYGMGDALTPPLKLFCKTIGLNGWWVSKLAPKINASYGNSMFATSMVFTMSQGSAAPNVIPQEAWVNANLRIAPTDTCEKCFKILEKIAKKFDLEMQVDLQRNASPMIDLNGEGYQSFKKALNKVYPDVAVVPYLMFGGTDCRVLQQIATHAIRCTPCTLSFDQLGGMHASNENVDIKSVEKCVGFFKTFIRDFK